MDDVTKLNLESFYRFILTDEGKRGYVVSFKGEANTTLRSFFEGLFSFIFSRRITTMSSYNEKALRVITNNYVDRINEGSIDKFPSEIVNQFIFEINKKHTKESGKFLNQNSSKLVNNVRVLQRASCYLTALEGGFRNDDFVNEKFIKYKNPDNSIKGAFLGAFGGFFGLGGCLGFLISGFILWAFLAIIVYIVELF